MTDEPLALHLTPKARTDLEEIWAYTVETWSEAQAERYLDTISESFDMLCAMPTMAREYHEFTPPVRIHPIGPHLVVYVADDAKLSVIRVLGAKQNWQAVLDQVES
ncbi:MAG: type II toxin-antitoxin system RelE/ParE family toxin [Rhodobacteraceae bacterium]|nr:MAG: type II toxin-antitoxin system RelE/ParE family toxin [Paracoccaceae bacterium]